MKDHSAPPPPPAFAAHTRRLKPETLNELVRSANLAFSCATLSQELVHRLEAAHTDSLAMLASEATDTLLELRGYLAAVIIEELGSDADSPLT